MVNNKKRVFFIFLPVLVFFIIIPLGLLPEGSPWGEWDSEELVKVIKNEYKEEFIPQGFKKYQDKPVYNAPVPDYSLPLSKDDSESFISQVIGYYISGIIGIVLCVIFYFLVKLGKSRKSNCI